MPMQYEFDELLGEFADKDNLVLRYLDLSEATKDEFGDYIGKVKYRTHSTLEGKVDLAPNEEKYGGIWGNYAPMSMTVKVSATEMLKKGLVNEEQLYVTGDQDGTPIVEGLLNMIIFYKGMAFGLDGVHYLYSKGSRAMAFLLVSKGKYDLRQHGGSPEIDHDPLPLPNPDGEIIVPPPPHPDRDTTPPGNVRTLRATATHDSITLTWSEPSDVDLLQYEVYRGGVRKAILNKSTKVWTEPNLLSNTGYLYTVFALDTSLNKSTGTNIEVTTLRAPSDPLPPGKVQSFTVKALDDGVSALVSWTPPSDSDLDYVEIRRTLATVGAETVVVGRFPKGITSVEDSGLLYDRYYNYMAKAVDLAGNDGEETYVYFKTTSKYLNEPRLTELNSTDTTIGFTWSEPESSDIAETRIYKNGILVKSIQRPFDSSTYWYTDLNPVAGGIVETVYRITLVGKNGNESPGLEFRAKTKIPEDQTPPAEVTNLKVYHMTRNSVILTWNNPTDSDFARTNIYRNGVEVGRKMPTDVPEFVDTTVVDGVTYDYRVVTVDRVENASTGVTLPVKIDVDAPPNVTSLTITNIASDVATLAWVNPVVPDLAGVEIYLGNTKKATLTNGEETYQLTNLTPETTFTVKIVAFDHNKNKASGTTSAFTTPAGLMMDDTTGLTTKVFGFSTFTPSTGKYNIYVDRTEPLLHKLAPSTASSVQGVMGLLKPLETKIVVWASSVQMTQIPLKNVEEAPNGEKTTPYKRMAYKGDVQWGTYYLIRKIQLADGRWRLEFGKTDISSSEGFPTWKDGTEDETPPGKVTNFTITSITQTGMTLSWTNPTDPDFKEVEIYDNKDMSLITKTSGTFHVLTGLLSNTDYRFHIRTVDHTGNKSEYVSQTAKTLPQSVNDDTTGSGYGKSNIAVFRYNATTKTHDNRGNGVGHGVGSLTIKLPPFTGIQNPIQNVAFMFWALPITLTNENIPAIVSREENATNFSTITEQYTSGIFVVQRKTQLTDGRIRYECVRDASITASRPYFNWYD